MTKKLSFSSLSEQHGVGQHIAIVRESPAPWAPRHQVSIPATSQCPQPIPLIAILLTDVGKCSCLLASTQQHQNACHYWMLGGVVLELLISWLNFLPAVGSILSGVSGWSNQLGWGSYGCISNEHAASRVYLPSCASILLLTSSLLMNFRL